MQVNSTFVFNHQGSGKGFIWACNVDTRKRYKQVLSKKLSNPIGTDLYSSIRMMSCIPSGRIDDIECVGYLLLYLHNGELPWSQSLSSEDILSMKKDNTFIGAPDYIKNFILSSRSHKSFDLKPDYNQFKAFLTI